MPFRFNAKNAFLTYPRCEETPRALGEFLETIRIASYILVVREAHRDGTHHLHALVQWPDKINVRNERIFDFANHHPNIQAARDVASVHEYITKALPANPTNDDQWTIGTLSVSRKCDKWIKVANATSEQECIEAALEASPRDFVLQHDRILEYARKKSRRTEPYRHDPAITFSLPEPLIEYMAREFSNPVGLLPWMYNEAHSFVDFRGNRIVLRPCCSQVQRALEKPPGRAAWALTYTGGACQISQRSTRQQRT